MWVSCYSSFVNWMGAVSIKHLWFKVSQSCVSATLLRLFSWRCLMISDPTLLSPPLMLNSVFSHLCGNHSYLPLWICLSTVKVSPVCLMDLPVCINVRLRVPLPPRPAESRGWVLPLFVPGVSNCEWDTADNGCFVHYAGCAEAVVLWTRRRLVKQRHTKALETDGRSPFSTVCCAASIRHLPQPCWITTLTTFHTNKRVSFTQWEHWHLLFVTYKGFLMQSFFLHD